MINENVILEIIQEMANNGGQLDIRKFLISKKGMDASTVKIYVNEMFIHNIITHTKRANVQKLLK